MGRCYLSIDDDFSRHKIFEIINECFGENYAGWMKAWYDVNEEFAAWFPTIYSTHSEPKGNFGGSARYTNTLSLDGKTIVEINHAVKQRLERDRKTKYDKNRFVFGRINGKFRFLGVFEMTEIDEKEGYTRYDRIATAVDLRTLKFID